MGLDMYLYRRRYVKNWDHTPPERRHEVIVKKGGKELSRKQFDPEKVAYVTEEAAYWRKANAIHNWFVENVQGEQDDCKEYMLYREDLEKLLGTISKVLASIELVDGDINMGTRYSGGKAEPIIEKGKVVKDPSVAQELLPTQSGFFYGGTDYDEYYVKQLEYTREVIKELLEADPDSEVEYIYNSSW